MPNTPRVSLTVLAAAGFILSLSTVVSPRTLDDCPHGAAESRRHLSERVCSSWPPGPAARGRAPRR